MKKYTYKAIWHDHGMLVIRSDGKRLSCCKRRTTEELNAMLTEKEMLAIATKDWKKFEK